MVFCILPNTYTYKEQQQQTFHPQEIKRLRSGQGKPAFSFLPLDCPGFSHANQTVSGLHLPPRGSHPLPSAPRPPPSCNPWSQPSLPLSPEPGSVSHKDPGWAVARLSHPDAGGGAGALPGAGPGASSTSGINYQRWLRSGLLCLPLTYLPG